MQDFADHSLHLTLYVAGGGSIRSLTARRQLEALTERLDLDVAAEVVDVVEDPARAEEDRILATPTLVRELPPPRQRVIGDLTDLSAVARALGLGTLATEVGE